MNELKEKVHSRMAELGISPKRSLGQNFLVSQSVADKIHAACKKIECEQIIEIGPGLGALTDFLRTLDTPFKAIELDHTFAEYWRNNGLEIVEQDALKINWSELLNQRKSLIVGNLPYQISSRLVVELSFFELPIAGMIFMFQREVAERLTAKPSTEDYGLLSTVAQLFWRIDVVTNAGSHDFYPAPRVGSRVVQFRPHLEQKKGKGLLRFLKAAFAQRRKLLVKNLGAVVQDKSVESVLVELGHRADIRAEALTPEQLYELFERIEK